MNRVFALTLSALTTLLLLASPLTAQETDRSTPDGLINAVFDEAVDALTKHQVAIRDDADLAVTLIDEIFSPHIHFTLMSQLVLTTHWRDADEVQRARFVNAFRSHLTRSYSNLLTSNMDQALRVIEGQSRILELRSTTEPDARGRVTVRGEFTIDAERMPVSYRLISTEDGWKIWDVVIENISFVTNFRDEFGSRVRRVGLDGLISELENRATPSDG
jgi:phospholipid transport system substrate-binding protein